MFALSRNVMRRVVSVYVCGLHENSGSVYVTRVPHDCSGQFSKMHKQAGSISESRDVRSMLLMNAHAGRHAVMHCSRVACACVCEPAIDDTVLYGNIRRRRRAGSDDVIGW